MELTLGRALRYKKRVVETLRRVEADINTNNCKAAGEEREVDVRQLLGSRTLWIQHLVGLKLAIQRASMPIQQMIFELAEAKAEIVFLERLPVNHGKQRATYREESETVYEAIIRKAERDQKTLALQRQIDQLQTAIDDFNAKTSIVFADAPVSLL